MYKRKVVITDLDPKMVEIIKKMDHTGSMDEVKKKASGNISIY